MKPAQRRKRAELEQRFGRADGHATRKAIVYAVLASRPEVKVVGPKSCTSAIWDDDHPWPA